MDKIEKIKKALLAYQKHNRLKTDLDAYLYELAECALDEIEKEPDPINFGLEL